MPDAAAVGAGGGDPGEVAAAGEDDVAVGRMDDAADREGPRLVVGEDGGAKPAAFGLSLGQGHFEGSHYAAAAADDAGRVFEEVGDLGDVFRSRLALFDVTREDAVLALRLASQALLKTSAHGLLDCDCVVLEHAVNGIGFYRRVLH
jgi:hypothetical protein